MERSRNHCFFMHIPKTAGSSLREILEARFAPEGIIPTKREMDSHWNGNYPPISWLLELPSKRWASCRLLRGHFHYQLADRFPQAPVCLTMLREPVARSISALRHFARHSRRYRDAKIADMVHDESLVKRQIANLQVRMLAARYPLNPKRCPKSVSFPMEVTEHELEVAKATLRRFAFVGIQEEFARSIELLFALFRWSGPVPQPRVNAAPVDAEDEIAPTALAELSEHNRADIDLYEFALGLFERRYRLQVETRAEVVGSA